MTLAARILRPSQLAQSDRDAMFALMDRHYENMIRARFETDLSEKDWVILLIDEASSEVCGFSTQALISLSIDDRPIRCVFSGDTIVDRDHWGSSALALAFGKLALHWIEAYPDDEVYWCLISKGFRTYRVLPVYFRDFHPRYDAEMPAELRTIIAGVAQIKFPDRFDQHQCLVKASDNSDRLRPGLGEITPERLQDPHVSFFVEKNPGHAEGDELCCIARMTPENFSAVAQRMIQSSAFARQRVGSC